MSGSARSKDPHYYHNDDYDDFVLNACGKGGARGQIMAKQSRKQCNVQGPGKVYSSKHVRLLEARRDGRTAGSSSNNNNKKQQAVSR